MMKDIRMMITIVVLAGGMLACTSPNTSSGRTPEAEQMLTELKEPFPVWSSRRPCIWHRVGWRREPQRCEKRMRRLPRHDVLRLGTH